MKALGARNKEAFNIDNGTVWSSGKVGDIFEDRFYYVPKDFGWLGKDFKGVKSLVSGIGLKVMSIEGKNFTKDMSGVTFKSMRDREVLKDNKESGSKLKRTLNIERVAYYKPNSGDIWELGKEICVVERKAGDRPVYLFFGFAQGSGQRDESSGYRLSWENADKNFLVEGYGCKNLPLYEESELRLRPDWSWTTGDGEWSARESSMIVLGNKDGIIQISGDGEKPIIAVALGLVVNKAQIIEGGNEERWKKILNDGDDMWRRRGWVKQKTVCLNTIDDDKEQVWFEKCWGNQRRIDAIKKYKANVKLTYSYKLKK